METALAFLPEGLPLWAAIAVVTASFFTAALTAAFGLGGGLALLAVMSAVFPAAAVIPIHGAAQIGANASRFALQRRDVVWPIVGWFTAGSIIGASLGGKLAIELPAPALQAGIAIFILFTVWGPRPKGFAPGPTTFVTTGAAAAFLTMFFGATGPIAATMLSATRLDRLNIVATHSACMVAQHGLKIFLFGLLGFAFREWTPLILVVVATGFAGTALGTRLLRRMPEAMFSRGFNFLLTAVAIYLLAMALFSIKIN